MSHGCRELLSRRADIRGLNPTLRTLLDPVTVLTGDVAQIENSFRNNLVIYKHGVVITAVRCATSEDRESSQIGKSEYAVKVVLHHMRTSQSQS